MDSDRPFISPRDYAMTTQEIADELGTNARAVAAMIASGLRKIRARDGSLQQFRQLVELRRRCASLIAETQRLTPQARVYHSGSNGESKEVKLWPGAERMLATLCSWYPEKMTVPQMRVHAGMKKGGTFDKYIRALRDGEYVEQSSGMIWATQMGRAYFGNTPMPPSPASTADVIAIWEPKLAPGAQRMLRATVRHAGKYISYRTLCEEANLEKSGTFDRYLRELRNAQLVVIDRGPVAANKETLFL